MDINRTIFYSVITICITFLIAYSLYIKTKLANIASDNNILEDKFTHCLQIAMSESRQSGKIIDIKEDKEICMNINKYNTVKK